MGPSEALSAKALYRFSELDAALLRTPRTIRVDERVAPQYIDSTVKAHTMQFTLNGRIVYVGGVSPNTTLLAYLRRCGLTGTKEGCAEGDCGACTVVLVDRDGHGRPCYRAINSCVTLLGSVAEREVLTVEGLAAWQGRSNGDKGAGTAEPYRLHPVQQSLVEGHGCQCGYCTPGIIMSLFEAYYRRDLHTGEQLAGQLAGNLCRCTGYRSIRDAAQTALHEQGQGPGDLFAQRLRAPCVTLSPLNCEGGGERFFRPGTLAELLDLRTRFPRAPLLAGGTELGLALTKRFEHFPTVISLEGVPELRQLQKTKTAWHVGAAVTLTELEERLAGEYPVLGQMLRVFGSRQIRNRATLGGNIATASPIGDGALVLLALDARVVLVHAVPGPTKTVQERTVPIHEFFVGYRQTVLEPEEVIQTIVIPRLNLGRGATRHYFWQKVSKRREMDISTVAACFRVDLNAQNLITDARLAYGGVAPTPTRALRTEQALAGQPWKTETITAALSVLVDEFKPISDVRGSAEYRRGLVISLFEKFYFQTTLGKAEEEVPPPKPDESEAAKTNPWPPHESARQHVTGGAVYTDDETAGRTCLEVWPVCSPHAHARIVRRDAAAARALPGIQAVLFAEDVPGKNSTDAFRDDEPLLAKGEVLFHQQIVALVVGDTLEACRHAAEKVVVVYEPLTPILTIDQALAAGSFLNAPNYLRRGDVAAALANAPLTFSGELEMAGQEHFYLETQAAWAEPGESETLVVTSATQHPTEVQAVVAQVLGLPANHVVVQNRRVGGGFGGKEVQAAGPAALAALAARRTGHAVRVHWNREQDMRLTGHRHPFLARFDVGFTSRGQLRATRVHLFANGGWALDLSPAITDRALFHLDNAYYIPAVEFRGQVLKTHLASNTAFRGFGGPQGMLVMEEILDRIARRLNLAPEQVRECNLYRGKGKTNTTHYGQKIGDTRLRQIWQELYRSSGFAARRRALATWNAAHPQRKRGLAITPVKFGISFTLTHLNQAGALVLLYQDGTVQVNHGGVEMGQGLQTNLTAIAARELGVEPAQIRMMRTSTEKVPNTSPTAASSGTDLNGAAVRSACATLRARLAPIAARLLQEKYGRTVRPEELQFADGRVRQRKKTAHSLDFVEVVKRAYVERVSLSATGFYGTPGIHWDRESGQGRPFHYFTCGAAVTEVEIDGFTGMMRVLRTDILQDAGSAINPAISRGQVEGGYLQGLGWLTTEDLQWDGEGRLLTAGPSTYKIPAIGDAPPVFKVSLLSNAAQANAIYGAKAVGEPPFMLALSVREAIRDAIAAFVPAAGAEIPLPVPATCEAIFLAIKRTAVNP